MKPDRLHRLTLTGLMLAAICVTTLLIQIPVVETRGYVHLGDAFILLTATLFGPYAGMTAGALGSALADLLGGYAHWAPFTLVIKGVEGLLAGALIRRCRKRWMRAVVLSLAALWMAGGYFLAECLLYTPPVAVVSLPGNLIQGAVSVVLALPLDRLLQKFVKNKGL